jgi:hypothetical protein
MGLSTEKFTTKSYGCTNNVETFGNKKILALTLQKSSVFTTPLAYVSQVVRGITRF